MMLLHSGKSRIMSQRVKFRIFFASVAFIFTSFPLTGAPTLWKYAARSDDLGFHII